jgi:hypothetical protein
MANAKLSTISAQCLTNAAAVATALGGGIVTSDVTALADFLKTLSLRNGDAFAMMSQTPPALASTYIAPG